MRCRFGLLGEGETGSPRKRFRARETADVGTGRTWEDSLAFGWGGSGEGVSAGGCDLRLLLVGVAKGFAREVERDFLVGEKGLNPGRGGAGSAGRGLGRVGFASFL